MASQDYKNILEFGSRGASSSELAAGMGEAHCHVVSIGPGGEIGPHEAGFGQLLVVLLGEGWVAGSDQQRRPIRAGQAAYIRRGETHSKGSDHEMMALMIQVRDLDLLAKRA